METILSVKKGILNFSINHEKNINNYLKRLEKSGSLATEQYKKSKPGVLYGLFKVQKAITDICFPFRPTYLGDISLQTRTKLTEISQRFTELLHT